MVVCNARTENDEEEVHCHAYKTPLIYIYHKIIKQFQPYLVETFIFSISGYCVKIFEVI